MKNLPNFETRTRYNDVTVEKFEGTGGLKAREFNDIIAILRTWIRENKLKIDDMDYISIVLHDENWDHRIDFTYNPDLVVSKKLEVTGTEPIGLESFIKSHWDI